MNATLMPNSWPLTKLQKERCLRARYISKTNCYRQPQTTLVRNHNRANCSQPHILTVETRTQIPTGPTNLQTYLQRDDRSEHIALGLEMQDRSGSVAKGLENWEASWKELGRSEANNATTRTLPQKGQCKWVLIIRYLTCFQSMGACLPSCSSKLLLSEK